MPEIAPSPQTADSNRPKRIIGRAPPAKFYGQLRWHLDSLLESDAMLGDWSVRQLAAELEIPRTTFRELRQFVDQHRSLILEAKASDDWTGVERVLFAGFGRYQHLPSYKRAVEYARRGPMKLEVVESKGSPGRPKGSRNKPKPAAKTAETPAESPTGTAPEGATEPAPAAAPEPVSIAPTPVATPAPTPQPTPETQAADVSAATPETAKPAGTPTPPAVPKFSLLVRTRTAARDQSTHLNHGF